MKDIRSIFLILLMVGVMPLQAAHTYTETSLLSTGHFVKIAVQETGICRISYEDLQGMGLRAEAVRVYGFGGAMVNQDFSKQHIDDLPAVPFYIHKGADGVFGAGDYILFYAQGPISWKYADGRFQHTVNPYSNQGFYFLSDDAGEPALLEPLHRDIAEDEAGSRYTITTFSDYRLHEMDSVNLIDVSGYAGGGREWYGERLTQSRSRVRFSFDFPNIVENSEIRAYLDVAHTGTEATSTVNVQIGSDEKVLNLVAKSPDHIEQAKVSVLNERYAVGEGLTQTVTLTYKTTNASAYVYVNYVEMVAQRHLRLTDQTLFFRTADKDLQHSETLYILENALPETQVWDVTHLDAIQVVPSCFIKGRLYFYCNNKELHELVALNPTHCKTISPVPLQHRTDKARFVRVANQNIHKVKDVDMVIISPEHLLQQARVLAEAHEQYDALKTVVVTDEQCYNEFSSGTPDATAYRLFMKMLYDRSNTSKGALRKPAYLLLFGDGTFDNRKLLPLSGQNTLLTYQARNSVKETRAYATDDYFTWLDDNEGTNDVVARMDASVGRLPVNTTEQAQNVVNKLTRYLQNATYGTWKNQLVFLADDGDGNLHTRASDRAAESVRKANPSFVVNKIYTDAYQQETTAAGETYPLAKNIFDNHLKDGVLLFDYCGHAGYNNITSESMLTAREVREMTNENLGIWVLATCNFANFDAQKTSAAEEAVLNPNGGALGVFASCRTVYAAQNEVLNQNVCDSLFAHRSACNYPHRLGDAFRLGKNVSPRDENNLPYLLLGDPAIRLHYPTKYQVTTTELPDTLRALTINTLRGSICNEAGEVVSDFNGNVHITILDKIQTITTLDNDQPNADLKTVHSYVDYTNTLFKGNAKVKNGTFECTFMIPKDIRYNFDFARIVYYAHDTITNYEAVGHYEDFMVGGSSIVEVVDTVGPDLNIYINNPAFRSGDKTNENPHFYADIRDEHGINTIGNGIGHDLLLILDNDPNRSYVMNRDYVAKADSYQEGTISYRLTNIEEGKHTLFFRAWDLLNNSSTATLDFEVVKGYALQIFSVLTYPNPVESTGTITFVIQHDKPDDLLQARYIVYDLSGRKVWEKTDLTGDRITLNAAEARLTAGIYMYRVELKTTTTNYTSKTGKIMVY